MVFDNKMKNGSGIYTFSDGTLYEGGFKDDKRHGMGKLSFTNGGFYHGKFIRAIHK